MTSVYAYPVLHCGHTFLRHIHPIACTTVLHCGHTFLNLSQETVTWSQPSKFDEKNTIPRAPSHVTTHYYGEVYGNIADLVAVTLLTFELSSLRENCFLVLLNFPCCSRDTSRWMPKSARRQNRENGQTDTQTHRTTTVLLIISPLNFVIAGNNNYDILLF